VVGVKDAHDFFYLESKGHLRASGNLANASPFVHHQKSIVHTPVKAASEYLLAAVFKDKCGTGPSAFREIQDR